MKQLLLFLLGMLCLHISNAQQYNDYLGAGHDKGVIVTTSHNADTEKIGSKSVDGFPVKDTVALADASRFLAQATMGYDYEMIKTTAAMGYEAWLDEQFELPVQDLLSTMESVAQLMGEIDDEGNLIQSLYTFRSAWWESIIKNPDLLRHKINYVFSQIFVTSAFGNDLFEDVGQFSAAYYDVLGKNAFRNYRSLIQDISLNPTMGLYLSHMDNPKADPARNIHPDENYAREVMQLFSIGLYELENNGVQKTDANGNFIATYDNDVIREFAKIFTGLGDGHPDGEFSIFGEQGEALSATMPMRMYEDWHEPGVKLLLNGQIVPAGQSGMQDINDGLDNIFNHPNVGPFIGKAMIQFLVSSNPSSEYVRRIAEVFNNNGQGVRGDLKAMIKAILLDPEARDCNAINNPLAGKMREPIIRYSQFLKAFNASPVNSFFESTMDKWYNSTGQVPGFSPSVFNFYQPQFQPNGPIASQDLVAPVFQIHNSSTAIGFINEVDSWTFKGQPMVYEFEPDPADNVVSAMVNYASVLGLANSPKELVHHLNLLLAAGQLSDRSKAIIENAASQVPDLNERLFLAIYLVMIAPDYAILK